MLCELLRLGGPLTVETVFFCCVNAARPLGGVGLGLAVFLAESATIEAYQSLC